MLSALVAFAQGFMNAIYGPPALPDPEVDTPPYNDLDALTIQIQRRHTEFTNAPARVGLVERRRWLMDAHGKAEAAAMHRRREYAEAHVSPATRKHANPAARLTALYEADMETLAYLVEMDDVDAQLARFEYSDEWRLIRELELRKEELRAL